MSRLNESASEPASEPAKVVLTDVKPSTSDKAMADAVDAALGPSSTTDQRVHSASNVRPDAISTWRNSLSFISDVYLCESSNLQSHTVDLQPYPPAYIFWSLFTSLIPTLFYFSVWKLGIAGHELALLSVLSPALLSLSSPHNYLFSSTNSAASWTVLDFARTRRGQALLQAFSLIGIAAYIVPSPGGRLGLVAAANIAAVMRQAVLWSGVVDGESDVGYQAIGMTSLLRIYLETYRK